ncbi:MAG: peptidoglycan D,D-transpeptidase FtsI family protein [Limisphaerales bacterium]
MTAPRNWNGVAAPVPPYQYRRLALMSGGLLLCFCVLLVRLVEIHVVKADELQAVVAGMRNATRLYTPLRGQIQDRNGSVLAYSMPVKEVKADPSLIGPEYAPFMAAKLAGPLGWDEAELTRVLATTVRTNSEGRVVRDQYALLKKEFPADRWKALRESLLEMDLSEVAAELSGDQRTMLRKALVNSIATEDVDGQVRVYEPGGLAGHVLGFVGHNPEAERNPLTAPTIGAEGLERTLNKYLEGIPGWRMTRMISRGGIWMTEVVDTFRARPGMDVMLTLDSRVQRVVEEALRRGFEAHRPKGISCVVMIPQTGEILAMASMPGFDPNDLGASTPEGRRNRVVTDTFEPGSTFKVLTIGTAMDAGVVSLDHRVNCGEQGAWTYSLGRVRRTLHDLHVYDELTVREVLAKSSNIGAAKVAVRLGEEELYRGLRRFGIGERTGIPLPAEASGRLRPLSEWKDVYSITSIPMGHEVEVTALQMTAAVGAVANDGVLMRPYLVKQIQLVDGQVLWRCEPRERGRAISARAARELTRGLMSVVEEPGGTGGMARLEHYTVAGKTGTADKWAGRRLSGEVMASFIGFFPAEAPRLCIGVFVDEPNGGKRFGGSTAGPIFREIASEAGALLGVPPSPSKSVNWAGRDSSMRLTQFQGGSRM